MGRFAFSKKVEAISEKNPRMYSSSYLRGFSLKDIETWLNPAEDVSITNRQKEIQYIENGELELGRPPISTSEFLSAERLLRVALSHHLSIL
jgi:hypothetical protein